MKKSWKTPELSRFGSVAEMTLASGAENQGKCPGPGDDAECGTPGGANCSEADHEFCSGGNGVLS